MIPHMFGNDMAPNEDSLLYEPRITKFSVVTLGNNEPNLSTFHSAS